MILQRQIIRGGGSLATFIGSDLKGKVSPLLYLTGIGLAFVRSWAAELVYAVEAGSATPRQRFFHQQLADPLEAIRPFSYWMDRSR